MKWLFKDVVLKKIDELSRIIIEVWPSILTQSNEDISNLDENIQSHALKA